MKQNPAPGRTYQVVNGVVVNMTRPNYTTTPSKTNTKTKK